MSVNNMKPLTPKTSNNTQSCRYAYLVIMMHISAIIIHNYNMSHDTHGHYPIVISLVLTNYSLSSIGGKKADDD